MTTNIEIRSFESDLANEIYISATPGETGSLKNQALEIFTDISNVLRSHKANIIQERVFSTSAKTDIISKARSEAYGDLDDGVTPSFLLTEASSAGPIVGIQIHAVSSNSRPEVISLDKTRYGRILRTPDCTFLTLSGICAPGAGSEVEQARAMMEKSESILKQFGVDFHSVPRTWMWLRNILSWYDKFNLVRNKFFIEGGLIGTNKHPKMPASTGVGIGPAAGGHCSMDLAAVIEPDNCIEYLQTTRKQHSAFEYGSAFSRASKAVTFAGYTVFVSGTASVNVDGATTNIGDVAGQINESINNVRVVLDEMQCSEEDLMYVIAYSKTPEIEQVFHSIKGELAWPCISVIGDICRDDLLFEIEAAAIPKR